MVSNTTPPVFPGTSIRLNLASSEPIRRLRRILDGCDYPSLYQRLTGTEDQDPWKGFRARSSPDDLSPRERILWELFYGGNAIPAHTFGQAFSPTDVDALVGVGILTRVGDDLQSMVVVLVHHGIYIVLDQPQRYQNGSWGSGSVYFDAISLEAARHLVPRQPIDSFLEIGPGSGLLLLEASRYSQFAVGIEVDPLAAAVSKLNVILNDRDSRTFVLVGDLASALRPEPSFQVIIFHPPYRILPPIINYPNSTARVGRGQDGLDTVRRFLAEAPICLRPDGMLLFGCELPSSEQGVPFFGELEKFALQSGWQVTIRVQATIAVSTQARVTAEKCLLANPIFSLEELVDMISGHYAALGFSQLVSCWVSIKRAHQAGICIE